MVQMKKQASTCSIHTSVERTYIAYIYANLQWNKTTMRPLCSPNGHKLELYGYIIYFHKKFRLLFFHLICAQCGPLAQSNATL